MHFEGIPLCEDEDDGAPPSSDTTIRSRKRDDEFDSPGHTWVGFEIVVRRAHTWTIGCGFVPAINFRPKTQMKAPLGGLSRSPSRLFPAPAWSTYLELGRRKTIAEGVYPTKALIR
ncbi:hypothetical protein CC2G_013321 [Coprinopsis cinerea AmutBmut pab1-1]|nr:hypothetical protein CC2G_013321 [Coprinopsis cinerea AmutBmut pab1-1]